MIDAGKTINKPAVALEAFCGFIQWIFWMGLCAAKNG
jgi:hypothetical protein